MTTISVPFRSISDKDFAAFASGYLCVRFPIQFIPHLGFALPQYDVRDLTSSPDSLTDIRTVVATPGSLFLGKDVCRKRLKDLVLLSLCSYMFSSKRVRMFGRSGAHVREKYTPFRDRIQLKFTLKRILKPSLTVRKPSQTIGAHFQEKWCACSGEVATPNFL